MTCQREHPVEILLVEDNPGDRRLTIEVFRDCKICNRLQTVNDGVEAMEYLRREGKYSDAVRPDLILLDLNMPRKNGREVLAEIKADKYLKNIPVVVMTTSDAEPDILKCYALGANCFVTKPIDLEDFVKVVHLMEEFWLQVVKLPSN